MFPRLIVREQGPCTVKLVRGPLEGTSPAYGGNGVVGAIASFAGTVRALEGGRRIVALDYEIYEPMTSQGLLHISAAAHERFGLDAVLLEHAFSRVPAGQCGFRLTVTAERRRAALEGLDWAVEAVKRDALVWKTAVWAGLTAEQGESRCC